MSVMSSTAASVRARPAIAVPVLAVPAALYAVALFARLVAISLVHFPLTEGSAYYTAVARNVATGRGFVVDSIWSYATPPLTLPRPAFELWQPLASALAALPMPILGTGFGSAQLAFALAGALLAPLAWLVARDAAARLDIPAERRAWVAAAAGVLVAAGGPFVLATTLPDSTLPFTILAVAACVALPRALNGDRRFVVTLGVLLGLAYLTRMEAMYLGIVFAVFAWHTGLRGRRLTAVIGAVAGIGALVAIPWWLRNVAVFGTPAPGQITDNALITANQQIFDYGSRPTLADFLAQGPLTIAANVAQALWHDFFDVLLVPGNVVAVAALVAIAVGWRRRGTLRGSPLLALLAYGALAYVVTSVVFPVATLWGTFEHASGPLMVAFAVVAAIGGDAFVARVRQWRSWPRPNAGMAPAALAAVVVAMTLLQVTLAGAQAATRQHQIAAVAATLSDNGFATAGTAPVITDRPLWLADALGTPTLVMPQNGAASVAAVARAFGAQYVVIVDGPLPGATGAETAPCFEPLPIAAPIEAPQMRVLRSTREC
jgi:hypothetical protein